jgi:carbon monoxide dehydrogenase subunit G
MSSTHQFYVAARLGRVWAAFNTPELIASCLPGATLTGAHEGQLTGTLRVKLGARTLTYAGTAQLEERHRGGRHTVLTAHGVDRRGQGTVHAVVTTRFTEEGDRTLVDVNSDTTFTGPPAQLDDDAVEDALGRLVSQLAENLSARFAAGIDPDELTTDVVQNDYDLFVRLAPVWTKRVGPPLAGGLAVLWLAGRIRRGRRVSRG